MRRVAVTPAVTPRPAPQVEGRSPSRVFPTDRKAPMSDRYIFTLDGKQYSLPKRIPVGALRKARKLEGADQIFAILETVADEATINALDSLEISEFISVTKKWMQLQSV